MKKNSECIPENEEFQKISDLLNEADFKFKPFFSTRVMSKIDSLQHVEFAHKLIPAFQKIVIPGIAVIIIFLAIIFFVNGSLSLDTIMGTEVLSNENLSAFVIFE